jgi:phosphohistidine phosphatase
MNLFILRHGQAHPNASNDAIRELTTHGQQETMRVIKDTLLKQNVKLSKIIASPYVRAQQTAQIAKHTLQFELAIETSADLLPESDPKDAFDFIAEQTSSSLLIVSHQPLVGCLLSLLESGAYTEQSVPTSGLAYITIDEPLMMGCGTLHWLVS